MKNTNEVLQQLVLTFVGAEDIKNPEMAIRASLATATPDYEDLYKRVVLDIDEDYIPGLLMVGTSQAVVTMSAGIIRQTQRIYMVTLPNRDIVLYVASTDGYHINDGPRFNKVAYTVFAGNKSSVSMGEEFLIARYTQHKLKQAAKQK